MLALPVYDFGVKFCGQKFNSNALDPHRNQHVLVHESEYRPPLTLLTYDVNSNFIGRIPRSGPKCNGLKNCPFCGGIAEIKPHLCGGFHVVCTICAASGPVAFSQDNHHDQLNAIDRWNSR